MAKLNVAERAIDAVDSPHVEEILNKDNLESIGFKTFGFSAPLSYGESMRVNSIDREVKTAQHDVVEK